MKIAILGAGFTGLSAAYHLSSQHQVTIFEKESIPGGLAISFQPKNWQWPLEKHYHHFFTSDKEIIKLAKEIDFDSALIYPPSLTSVLYQDKIFPFNGVKDILTFNPLDLVSRLRLGIATVLLKITPVHLSKFLEKTTAVNLARLCYGEKIYQTIWEPLLKGKFGKFYDQLNAAWLWARIKKRTLKLGYFRGGYQAFAQQLEKKVLEKGVVINYQQEITKVSAKETNQWEIQTKDQRLLSDIVISTLPTPIFVKLFDLSVDYQKRLSSIPHLHALNLLLELNQPFLEETYWLNINQDKYPFLCLTQHTNFIDKKHYGGNHLLYVGNYLNSDHEFLKKSKEELLEIFLPFLQIIKPDFQKNHIVNSFLFLAPFAQPVFLPNYAMIRPFGKTPLKNLYFANIDSVYPWDRGTNYALEIGRKIAEIINS